MEWRNSTNDLRLSMNLASALNNIAEYYWHEYKTENPERVFHKASVTAFRSALSEAFTAFGLIRDIADGHKHMLLNRKDATVSSTDQVAHIKVGFGQTYGLCYGGGKLLQIELNDGQLEYFYTTATEVYDYWQALILPDSKI